MEYSLDSFTAACGEWVHVRRGTCIYRQSCPAEERAVYLLSSGICALTSLGKDGKEDIYLYFYPKRLVGFNQIFLRGDGPRPEGPEFSIVAKTNCLMYRIPEAVFLNLTRTEPGFNALVLETMAGNYRDTLLHFHSLVEDPILSRLCRLLLQVSREEGGQRVVPRFFTYPELAKYLGAHPVTVSRLMAGLKKQGYLTRLPEGLSIEDPRALEALIEAGTLPED